MTDERDAMREARMGGQSFRDALTEYAAPLPEAPESVAWCGASMRADFARAVPYIGPCVLRRDHDGPVHQDADGVQWATLVGRPPEPEQDVPGRQRGGWSTPDELPATVVAALQTAMDDHDLVLDDWDTREILAAALPRIDRAIRAQVAAELAGLRDGVANPDRPYNEAFRHALDCAIRHITPKETP